MRLRGGGFELVDALGEVVPDLERCSVSGVASEYTGYAHMEANLLGSVANRKAHDGKRGERGRGEQWKEAMDRRV